MPSVAFRLKSLKSGTPRRAFPTRDTAMNLQQSVFAETQRTLTRRWFFNECGVGLGAVALHSLLQQTTGASPAIRPDNPLSPHGPQYPAKAKNVIFLFMAGAPSHLELFDNKPTLAKLNGQLPPPELVKGYRAAFINPNATFLGPKFKFAKYGKCGA